MPLHPIPVWKVTLCCKARWSFQNTASLLNPPIITGVLQKNYFPCQEKMFSWYQRHTGAVAFVYSSHIFLYCASPIHSPFQKRDITEHELPFPWLIAMNQLRTKSYSRCQKRFCTSDQSVSCQKDQNNSAEPLESREKMAQLWNFFPGSFLIAQWSDAHKYNINLIFFQRSSYKCSLCRLCSLNLQL